MGVGDAVVSARFAVGGSHITPSCGDGCSDVEACREMNVAIGTCSRVEDCGGVAGDATAGVVSTGN
jgi:hypothetical protein